MIMVKPALAYLDIIRLAARPFSRRAAGGLQRLRRVQHGQGRRRCGWIDERRIVLETLTGIRRAGADMHPHVHGPDVARWLGQGYLVDRRGMAPKGRDPS